MHRPHVPAQNLVGILWAAVIAVTGGFVWTVGQTGLTQTNNNLCELWRALPLPKYRACEFQQFLVYLWLIAAFLGAIYILFEVYSFIGSRQRSARLYAHGALVIFFACGLATSLYLLVRDWNSVDDTQTPRPSEIPIQ
jgi:hypothetical protein